MSRREGRDSQSKRLHSRSEREPSPKRNRRDGKPATERTYTSNLNQEIADPTDRDQKHRRRLQDALPLEPSPATDRDQKHRRRLQDALPLEPSPATDRDQKHHRRLQDALPLEPSPATESKVQPDVVNKGTDKKDDELSNGAIRSSDPTEIPQSRTYFQHDERGSAGQGGRSIGRRETRVSDHRRWSDPEEQLGGKARDKAAVLHKKDEMTQNQTQVGDRSLWRHDGFFELEADAPPARRRPAFREKKMPAEDVAAGAAESESVKPPRHDRPEFGTTRREERGSGYNPRGPDKPDRPVLGKDERNVKRGDWSLHRTDMQRSGFQSREKFSGSQSARGRDRPDGRHGERDVYRPGGVQVEKWKHDLFDEANRSPTPKNEEDQIAKVEALLAL